MNEMDGWREVIRHEEKLVGQIRMLQRTFRIARTIPTWTNFLLTSYYRHMTHLLDPNMIRKFRAWWELLLECGDTERPEGRCEFAFCRLFLLQTVLMRRHNKPLRCDAQRMGISEERAGQLREAVLSRYETLTLH